MSVELAVHRRVAEVPAAEWDAVVGPDELQLGRRFLAACEAAGIEDTELRYVTAVRRGEPQAVAVLSVVRVALDLLSGPGARRAVGAVRRWRPSFLRVPIVMCGPPVSFGQPGVKIAPGADAAAVLSALHDTMEAIARERGAEVTAFKELDAERSRELAPLRALGYFPARSLPSWSLRLPWSDWDGYLAGLRAGYRRQARTTLRDARAAGLRARTVADLPERAEDVGRLYDAVMRRARHRMEWLPRSFFAELGRRLPAETRVVLLERGAGAVACAVMLHGPALSTFLLAGVDWDDPAAGVAYPALVQEVLREAIRSGARALELGQTSDAMKSRMGASPSPRWIHLRHRGALRHRVLDRSSRLLFPETRVPARRVFAGAAWEPEGP